MKRFILSISILITSIFLISCNRSNVTLNFSLNNNPTKINIDVNYYNKRTIKETGIIYSLNKNSNLTYDENDYLINSFDNFNNTFHIKDILVKDYNKMFFIKGYVILNNNEIIYSNKEEVSVIKLAIKINDEISKEILKEYDSDYFIIDKVDINVDLKKYEIINISVNLKATIKTDYKKVYIKIKPEDNYIFNNNLKFYFNNSLIDKNNYELKSNELIYTYDDPNWSGIY